MVPNLERDSRIVSAHREGHNQELSECYFGDPDEMDDYELAEDGYGPTHYIQLPPVPTSKPCDSAVIVAPASLLNKPVAS
jgi:hypothetical protein